LKPYVSRDNVGNYCDDVYVLDYVRDPEDDMLSDIMPTTKEMGTGFKIDHVPADNRKSLSNLLTPLINENSVTFICGHGYHTSCYNGKCVYCEEFYKRGIFENVNAFLKRVEKGTDIFTHEDLDNEENDIEKEENQSEEIGMQDISNKLQIEISQIENW
jgi:hypothetical protein